MEDNKLTKIVKWLCRKPINTKTHRNEKVMQRNELCYCGSKKKFKHCCWAKHAVLETGSMSPEMAAFVKKQDVYFRKRQEKKHG